MTPSSRSAPRASPSLTRRWRRGSSFANRSRPEAGRRGEHDGVVRPREWALVSLIMIQRYSMVPELGTVQIFVAKAEECLAGRGRKQMRTEHDLNLDRPMERA